MPESKIIKPEKPGIDLSLFTRVVPGVIIGERFMAISSIEHVEWTEVTIDIEAEGEQVATTTSTQLGVAHTSGSIYFFDEDEERELEAALKEAIQKAESQMTQLQALQQEVHMRGQRIQQLEEELARLTLRQMQGGKMQVPGFRGKI